MKSCATVTLLLTLASAVSAAQAQDRSPTLMIDGTGGVAKAESLPVTSVKEDLANALPATDSQSALAERGPEGPYYFRFADKVVPPCACPPNGNGTEAPFNRGLATTADSLVIFPA